MGQPSPIMTLQKIPNALHRLNRRLQVATLLAAATLAVPLAIVAYGAAHSPDAQVWERTFWGVLVFGGLSSGLLFSQTFTKIRNVMERLLQSESHWRQLMELSGDWYWEQDAHGRLVNILRKGVAQSSESDGPTYLPFVGLKRWEVPGLELIGMTWDEFKVILEQGRPFDRLLLLYNTQQGRRVYFETTGRPIVNQDGVLIGYRGVSVNLTQRYLNERLLHAERLFLQGMLLSIPMVDLLAQIAPALCESLGMKSDIAIWWAQDGPSPLRYIGSSNKQLKLPPEYAQLQAGAQAHGAIHPVASLFEGADHCFVGAQSLPAEWREAAQAYQSAWFVPVKGGGERPYAVIAVLYADSQAPEIKDQLRLADACRVISLGLERMFFERELQDLNHTLEQRVLERTSALTQTNQELEAFTYTVSHDLRAPLRAIDGFSGILMEDFRDTLPEDAVQLLNRISNNARQMGGLIDGLLDFSRLLRADVSRVRLDNQELVERVCEQLDAKARATLVIDPLPDSTGDPVLIGQVWMNLIDNALKFSNKAAQPTVHIFAKTLDGFVEYCVQDNGAGFDMAYKDKLFNVFERLHHKKDFDGTGVGLATVKRIIERHGGVVCAEGNPGQGACFSFRLPVISELPVQA